ncbi:PQQ-like domain-containing protein [Nocardiopsis flavescens]|uniref:PQQ-like domain-containing protein n=2 Tax=Nocardiopsis flavescens TaxID=758803 RepID=A0A1M6L6H7_9ACTN|nr:PQQ-like domain-containing protein [Nocardiopsis flavescens]
MVFLPIALLATALTGCSPLRIALPQGGVEPDQGLFDHPPSELSAEEPLLCLDGERDGADCTEPGALRWSVPLEGVHYVGLRKPEVVFDTRSRLNRSDHLRGLVSDGALHHFSDDLVLVHDLETGRHLWTADLRRGAPKQVDIAARTGDRVFVGLQDGRHLFEGFDELVVLDSEDGTETARLVLADTIEGVSRAHLVGIAEEGGAVVLRHSENGFFGMDPISGDELWRVETRLPWLTDALHDRTHWFADGSLDIIAWSKETPHSDWEAVDAQRFDGLSGAELAAPESGVEYRREPGFWPGAYRPGELFDEEGDGAARPVPLTIPSYDIHPGRWEALSGVGTRTLSNRGGGTAEAVSVTCAPDALRVEYPPPLPEAVRCDNARLFVVNL